MKTITAILAEDEVSQREDLVRLLKLHWPELELAAVCEDGLEALEALAQYRPQVAFLDIRMPGAGGLEVARAAAAAAVHVVFVTAYDEHAVAAFEAGVVDYLIKPVTAPRLLQTIERLKTRLEAATAPDFRRLLEALDTRLSAPSSTSSLKWVTASLGDTVKMFPIDEVLFFQAQDKYVRVVTRTDEAVIRTPLRELVRQLDGEEFWQIHRSVIVRASTIDRVQKDSLGHQYARVKGSGELLPVSSAYQARFKSM